MAYGLEEFCADVRAALSADDGKDGREEIRRGLEKLLVNEEFVAATCGPQAKAGVHTLFHDPDMDFMVLAHINDESRTSPPHDHGDSWAVYGQAVAYTEMTEYDRTDDGSDAELADVEKRRTYRLDPGMAGMFGPSDIHSIHFPAGARFIRVTGTDLSKIKTQRFNLADKAVTEVAPSDDGTAAGSASV